MGVYGEPSRLAIMNQQKASNHPACNENMAGSLEIPVVLEANEEKELIIFIGNTSDIEQTRRIINKLLVSGYTDKSFRIIKKMKEAMIKHTVVKTPDERINKLTNIWAKNQAALCAEFGRDGVRGFRDTLQDAWAILSFNPALAKEKIVESLRHQNRDG